jgi:hypothetical protein
MATFTNPNKQYQELKDRSALARLPYEKDWWLNVAFYLGEQYTEWAADASTIRRIERKGRMRNAPRPVVNKIMHFVNQEHAFALQSKPTLDVLPATDDPIDQSEASVALAYLRNLTQPQVADLDNELSDATLWALLPGPGYLKWFYNTKEDRPDVVSCSPFDIYTDPFAKNFRKSRYVIHSQFMDVEQVYDSWGVEVKADEVQKADLIRSAMMREMGSAPVLNGITVNELWMKPNRRHEKGLYVVWAGNKQLAAPSDFPYKHGKLPFTQLGSIPRPNSLHYDSAVKYLRPAQMELNKYHAQRIAIRETFANPKWWVPSELELEAPPDDSPWQVLTGNSQNGQLEPKLIQPTTFPGNDDGVWLGEEMMNIVGLHEVSQGQVPGRVEAAKAIELLKESDESRLACLLQTIKTALSDGGWQWLMLAKQFVKEEQIVASYSREGVPEVHRFKSETVKEEMRVQITMGTGLAYSRAARQDLLMQMWMNQVIRDPEVMAELMDVPLPNFISEKAFDIRLARNENLDLAQGTAIVPNSWDDHMIHLREHNNYRKTHEFLMLDSKTKTKFEFHCTTHEALQLEQVQKQAALMAAAQGAQPGQPAPGQPGGPQQDAADQNQVAYDLQRSQGPQ